MSSDVRECGKMVCEQHDRTNLLIRPYLIIELLAISSADW